MQQVYVIQLFFEIRSKIESILMLDFCSLHFREFEKLEQEEEQDLVPDEPEVRISREELLARYQVSKRLLKKNQIYSSVFKRLLKLSVIV